MRCSPIRWRALSCAPREARGARRAGPAQDERITGVIMWVRVRTRFLDDLVLDACANGCRQIVTLGAGLDARAFRLDLPAGARLFELDLSEILEFKQRVVGSERHEAACERIVVPTDLTGEWAARSRRGRLRRHATHGLARRRDPRVPHRRPAGGGDRPRLRALRSREPARDHARGQRGTPSRAAGRRPRRCRRDPATTSRCGSRKLPPTPWPGSSRVAGTCRSTTPSSEPSSTDSRGHRWPAGAGARLVDATRR